VSSQVATGPAPLPLRTVDGAPVPSRYRHPGDVVRLVLGSIVLVIAVAVAALASDQLYGPDASTVRGAEPSSTGGHIVIGLVQVTVVVALLWAAVSQLRHRRFRLVATVAGAAVVAGLLFVGISRLLGTDRPARLRDALASGSWLGSAHFPSAAWLAGGAAVAVALGPWLARPWRRAAWTTLVVVALARLVTGTVLPVEVVIAFSVGGVVASAVLVAFGSPDRRLGAGGVAAALACAGLPVADVEPLAIPTKGSVPFLATRPDGSRLFVKVMGRDQRDADLLYRGWRMLRLRHLGDVRPAASLRQAVEHQALVAIMASRAGVSTPRVERVGESGDGSALLAMDVVEGRPLDELEPDAVSDDVLVTLWRDVDRLHGARIAHRSLRTGNVAVDPTGAPHLLDFSFSELSATERQMAVDRAELLASTAVLVGPERAVADAVSVVGVDAVGDAVPLLQPLALSAATRRSLRGTDKLLDRTRAAAAEATGRDPQQLVRVQRVSGRTLLMTAVLAGAFYFLLPQLANVNDAWDAFTHADFAWIPVMLLMSVLTYVGAAFGVQGSVPHTVRFVPSLLTQTAASFVNRVTPASIGGMVLNGRFLEKSGVDPATAVAGVGLNSVAGGIVHVVLIVVFFTWSGSELGKAFKLPTSSKALLIVPIVLAVVGAVLATRWGRHKLLRPLVKSVRSALHNLALLSRSPMKLLLLFGGSTLVTLAYIVALQASVLAMDVHVSLAKIGAVYLAASAVASAAPTPGNLGALEAALVAGLTGVGVPGADAVSAVLAYRLATYWLPILPGWLCWHLVQRYEYV
jgi:undecaprenyl-diphosphatase